VEENTTEPRDRGARVLQELFELAGQPTHDSTAARAQVLGLGKLSSSTVGNLLNGTTKPHPSTVERFISTCLDFAQRRRPPVLDEQTANAKFWRQRFTEATRPNPGESGSGPNPGAGQRPEQPSGITGPEGRPFPVVVPVPSTGSAPLRVFVGRDEQILDVLNFIGHEQREPVPLTMSISGMGGVGKTSLAYHAATEAIERGSLTGDAYLVNMHGYDSDGQITANQVFAPILRSLGLSGHEIPAEPADQAAVYHRLLQQRAEQDARILLILDNVADSRQVQALLPTSDAHRVLITTRDILSLPDVQHIRLECLTGPESVDLLDQALRRQDPHDRRISDSPGDAAHLARICGFLPLAIVIVAGLLSGEPQLRTGVMASEVVETIGLEGFAHGERDLLQLFDLAWRRFYARNAEAALLLAMLALHSRDCSTAAAAAFTGEPVGKVRSRLRALHQAHWIMTVGEGRWSMHDLVRVYALAHIVDRVEASEARLLDQAMDRLSTWYAVTVDAADNCLRAAPGQPMSAPFAGRDDAMRWIDVEYPNLIEILVIASRAGLHQTVIVIGEALTIFMEHRILSNDRIRVALHTLSAARQLHSEFSIANSLNNIGLALEETHRLPEAIAAYRKALDLFEDLGDPVHIGNVLNNLGKTLRKTGEHEAAIAAHRRDIDLCQETGNIRGEAIAWDNLAAALTTAGHELDSINAFRHAIEIFHQMSDTELEGRSWSELCVALLHAKRAEEALAAAQNAVGLCADAGDHRGVARSLNKLGVVLADLDRLDEALIAYRKAVAISETIGDEYERAATLSNLGNALADAGRCEEALTVHDVAIVVARAANYQQLEGVAWCNLGTTLNRLSKSDEAKQCWQRALEKFRVAGTAEDVRHVEKLIIGDDIGPDPTKVPSPEQLDLP
jgi:tetratricopeptide (TPR) repeat protein